MDPHSENHKADSVRRILQAYSATPDVVAVRRNDRLLAIELCERGVSVETVESALILATARRLMRPAEYPPLQPIRSLAYFLPVIEEVLQLRPSPDYIRYLRRKIQTFLQNSARH